MKQLALGISPPPQPTLDNFVPGANAELVSRLRELNSGKFAESVLYLWGESGAGKSHLLRACTAAHVADDVETLNDA
jgi:DnaA family protein